jgi:hypothetical protein
MAIVTFDPIALIISEVGAGVDNALDWQDIYSEWKAWLLADVARLGYPAAFRYAGADPISETRSLGSTFFLLGGWRLRPAELSHRLTLVGNCYTDPAGYSVIVPTLGSYTVAVELATSNLIDTVATGGTVAPSPAEIVGAVQDGLLAQGYTSGRAPKLDALDAAITSRAAPGSEMALTSGERTATATAVVSRAQSLGVLTASQAAQLLELWRLSGLDTGAPLTVTETSRSTSGVVQTIGEVGGTVTVTRTS